MANRIKGITVEIGGDTTKLQTALKGVNSSIKDTQSQLKDVEKLLKLDPGNTELLAQKQKLLSDAVSETKERSAFAIDAPGVFRLFLLAVISAVFISFRFLSVMISHFKTKIKCARN